ncbi:MAG: methyltransferase domain-containing protein [Gemmatimonadota bacterium]
MSRWDERYAQSGYAYGTAPNDFLVEAAPAIPAGPVLSLAEGEGRNAVFLAARGYTVTAVDASPIGLSKAARLAAERGVRIETRLADLEANFDLGTARWAGVVSIWCHLPRRAREQLHAQMARALLPGGVFILEAYTPRQLRYGTGGPSSAALLPALDDLRQELKDLELEIAREVVRQVQEGRMHHGESAVVQLLGRRAGGASG